jgi:hypothetical protein
MHSKKDLGNDTMGNKIAEVIAYMGKIGKLEMYTMPLRAMFKRNRSLEILRIDVNKGIILKPIL